MREPATLRHLVYEFATRQAADVRRRGGDVFAFAAHRDGGGTMLVGDVSSKGLLGYRHAELVREAFVRATAHRLSPAETLRLLNRLPLGGPARDDTVFASALIATVVPGDPLVYAAAGTDGALIVRGKHHEHLGSTGPVLGIFADAAFDECRRPFGPDDRLVIATDGVVEARDPADARCTFGTFGIVRALCGPTSHEPSAHTVMQACDALCRGVYRDDATVALIGSSAGTRVSA